MTHFYGWLIK